MNFYITIKYAASPLSSLVEAAEAREEERRGARAVGVVMTTVQVGWRAR